MTIASGIDAGGTYTEAVLVNHDSHTVLTGGQALTTRHDLSVGIGQAVSTGSGHSLPVACGHGLTTGLNAVRRATTVALNARLIPLLRELIVTVRHTLQELDIAAPLNGRQERRGAGASRVGSTATIETILSGPAASAVGAWHLAGRRDVWVVDVGGTTTGIAAPRDGRSRLNPEGAQVGHQRAMF